MNAAEECPPGVICVDVLPHTNALDTTNSAASNLDGYSCAPDTDESGPEFVFRVEVPQRGFLGVSIDDAGEGIDIDAHLLETLDPSDCIDRGNADAGAVVDAGVVYVVADTYVSSEGPQAGPFAIVIDLFPLNTGDCAVESGWMERVNDGGVALQMPATGPMALEAHLVTVEDGYGSGTNDPWPQTITESIPQHYQTSQTTSGFVMSRGQPWAPQEGCEFGQGACGAKLPVADEHWYVNMYWSERPEEGTRMIVQGETGRAVVVAAGYETGPGNLDYVGGTTEEVHHYLGTGHGSTMTLGFAVDPLLPLGPIDCE